METLMRCVSSDVNDADAKTLSFTSDVYIVIIVVVVIIIIIIIIIIVVVVVIVIIIIIIINVLIVVQCTGENSHNIIHQQKEEQQLLLLPLPLLPLQWLLSFSLFCCLIIENRLARYQIYNTCLKCFVDRATLNNLVPTTLLFSFCS